MQALLLLYRIGHWLYRYNIPLIPKLIYLLNYLLFNSSIPSSVKIGKGSKFAYGGIGVVIHANAVIGNNCIIGQGITIGGRSKNPIVPIICDNVYMGAGCRVLGPIKIQSDVIIAPNAVVMKSVQSNSIVAGVPSKVIKSGIKVEDYV